jgi:hypothetical protein
MVFGFFPALQNERQLFGKGAIREPGNFVLTAISGPSPGAQKSFERR